MVSVAQDGTDILAPFGFPRIIENQMDSVARLRVQGLEQLLSFLPRGRLGVPSLEQAEVIEAAPARRSLQIPVRVGDIPPTHIKAIVRANKRK